MTTAAHRCLNMLRSALAPPVIIVGITLLTVQSYLKLQEGDSIFSYSCGIYISCLLLVALLAGQRGANYFSEKLYQSEYNGSSFILLGAALLFVSIFRHLSIWTEFPELLNKAYGHADARSELYKLRSLIFDGSLEYSYLLLMGSFILPINLRFKKLSGTPVTIFCIALIGTFELSTLSRFTSVPLIVTCMLAAYILLLNLPLRNKRVFKIYGVSTIIIFLIGISPIILRTTHYKHWPSLYSDAETMNQGITMRESTHGLISGLSINNGYQSDVVKQHWRNHQIHHFSIDDHKMATDFLCSVMTGPYLENILCSGYAHYWQRQAYSDYYVYSKGPVLKTAKYWEYGNNLTRLIIAFSWTALILPLIGVLSNLRLSATFYEAWLTCAPIYIVKLISFFRGDPIHSGIHYLWMLIACMMLIHASKCLDGHLRRRMART